MTNILIKASAGTGKTFALATHAIRLLLVGTPPRAIIGLTFSRAAAGEIFNGIAKRLAGAARNEAGTRRETAYVMEGLAAAWAGAGAIRRTWENEGLAAGAPAGLALPARVYARLLRRFVHEQHISRIGTIDSFMAQMVKAFPVEMGLEGAMTIMDDFEARREKGAAADALLAAAAGDEDSRALVDEFRLALVGREAKRFCDLLDAFVASKHETFLQHPEPAKWGDPVRIWGAAGMPYRVRGSVGAFADRIESQLVAALDPGDARGEPGGWPAVVQFVRGFSGSFTGAPTPFKNILEAWDGSGAIAEFNCNRVSTPLNDADTRLMAECLETLVAIALTVRCLRTRGIHRLMKRLDAVYAQSTRRRGRVTFADIPRMIAQLGEVSRRNLEYRFDGELRHWALDEFQDTSHAQWEAIRNLVDEARSDEQRTVFVVGDMKQAIYGWRGGDVAIFEHEAASGCYREQQLFRSHRYCPEIAEFVNRVFDGEKIAAFLPRSEAGNAGEKWRQLWARHESAVEAPGWVSVARVREAERGAEKAWEPFAAPILEELTRVRPWEKGLTTALLVRTNDQGEAFADALRKGGVPAVWEGESDIADTPVVQAFLNLLRFAEHPGDTQAWAHICASPLRASQPFADLISARDGRDPEEALMAKVTTDVSRLGLARTLRAYADAVRDTLDAYTRNRVESLIRAACTFAAVADAGMSLTDFADYVEDYRTRAAADASVVKVLTVHRSKGLGFDYVIVPVIDERTITALPNQRTFHAPGWEWLLDQPPPGVLVQRDAVLAAADRAETEAGVFEALCGYYVGMTRARRALSVYLRAGGKELNFSNHVETALGQKCPLGIGNAAWHEGAVAEAPRAEAVARPRIARRRRVAVQRATPSRLGHGNVPASTLFAAQEAGAAERGSRIHALLSAVEWLDEGVVSRERAAACGELGVDLMRDSAFRQALLRPDGVAELWRERNFEMLADGQWTSGTFDRVVFQGSPGAMRATIYDFKSNRRREGEGDEAFGARMREAYAPQMAAYRAAVAKLTGLDGSVIRATLLLTETMAAVPVA